MWYKPTYFQFLYRMSLCVLNFISIPINLVDAFPVCVCNQPLGRNVLVYYHLLNVAFGHIVLQVRCYYSVSSIVSHCVCRSKLHALLHYIFLTVFLQVFAIIEKEVCFV